MFIWLIQSDFTYSYNRATLLKGIVVIRAFISPVMGYNSYVGNVDQPLRFLGQRWPQCFPLWLILARMHNIGVAHLYSPKEQQKIYCQQRWKKWALNLWRKLMGFLFCFLKLSNPKVKILLHTGTIFYVLCLC